MERGQIGEAFRSAKIKKARVYALGLVTGLVAGLVVIAYRLIIAWFEALRGHLGPLDLGRWPRLVAWLALTAAGGMATALFMKIAPQIKGSGIPQVKAALMRKLSLDWARELPLKFSGGALALGAGLSLGREGPSIQLGALAGTAVADIAGQGELRRYLVTAGAAAGISAAFNAPLAGVLFCLEELHRSFSPVMLTCSMIAALAANAVSWLLLGGGSVFDLRLGSTLPLEHYHLVLAVGILCGLLGPAFNVSILGAQSLMKRIVPSERLRIVVAFMAGGLIALGFPAIAGGGQGIVESVGAGGSALSALCILLAGKLVFTIFSYGSGAPGGIFLPMLAIGATAGALSGHLFAALGLAADYAPNFAILGMVGFFTAVVRAPITGAILVTEMTGSFGHFPALILVSLVASLVAGLIGSEPIYDSLLAGLSLQGKQPRPQKGTALLHIPVFEGSVIDLCESAQAAMPEGCVLVCVQRGEAEFLPRRGLDIQPGDILQVLVDEAEAGEMKRELLRLASAKSGHLESGA